MSQFETLMARDGHTFNAYLAKPTGTARGGIVIVQEVYGLTAHIRAVADSYAADGYLAVAPALFDRVQRDVVLGYTPEGQQQGMGYRRQIDAAKAVLDIAAAAAVAGHNGKVAVVGYCWGGRLAWLTACQVPLSAAVSYYGGGIGSELTKTPMCPMMLHFGGRDSSIPPEEIARIHAAFPRGLIYVYPDAGHAFNNSDRPQAFEPGSAALARQRTSTFLTEHLR